MPISPKINDTLNRFRRAWACGRMPHALVVSGHPRGSGGTFTEGLLALVFHESDAGRVARHADIHRVEPESKSRQISVEAIRGLIEDIGLSSYEGGWKAGVILFADRLTTAAQSALLKTLEEPPPNSLLVLVTGNPNALLATIRSRSQFVDVTEDISPSSAAWYPVVKELLRNPPARRGSEMISWSDRLNAPLRELESQAKEEEENRLVAEAEAAGRDADTQGNTDKETVKARVATRVREAREEILRMILHWQHDVLLAVKNPGTPPEHFPLEADAIAAQAAGLSFADAVRRVDVVEDVRGLLEHNIKAAAVLPRMARAFSVLTD